MKEKQIDNLIRAARLWAAENALSWFAPALHASTPILREDLPFIAGVDRWGRIYFNPHQIQRVVGQRALHEVLPEVAFLWYHEIAHLLREHASRAEDLHAQPLVWNLAADLEINDFLPEGLRYPQDAPPTLPQQYELPDGRTAEYYYQQLRDRQQAGQSLWLTAASRSRGVGAEQGGDGDKQATDAGLQSEGSAIDEGSGVHGEARYWEMPADTEGVPAWNEFDAAAIRHQVAQEILHKSRGDLPAGWVRWAEEQLRPRVDWRKQLQRAVRGAISDGMGQKLDYTFRRPHRRASVYHPLYLPALSGQYLPHVACVVDTSGSMSEKELSQAMAEVRGVLEQVHARLTVIPCDAVPYEPIQVLNRSHLAQARRGLKGGGGTDMREGIKAALELQPPPDAILVLTDGETPYPEHTYRLPVVFGILQLSSGEEPPLPPVPPWKPKDIVQIPVAGPT